MELLNVVEIDKTNGFCSVEIYHGDITEIGFPVDLLVVSAFKNNYYPTQGTVIGALKERHSIDLHDLFNQENINLKESLNCWITQKHKSALYKYILVFEIRDFLTVSLPLADIFRNLFISISVLNQMGAEIKTIAMPVLGTGNQAFGFEEVITALLAELKKSLRNNSTLERLLFVEYNKEKSEKLSKTLDSTLNRVKLKLPVNEVIKDVKEEILNALQNSAGQAFKNSKTYQFFRKTLKSENAMSVEYGIACRRMTEKLINEMYFSPAAVSEPHISLLVKIQKLSEANVANWVISYLHVIRIFGNESAHEVKTRNQVPKKIEARDLSLLLFCMQRVVEFWAKNKKSDK